MSIRFTSNPVPSNVRNDNSGVPEPGDDCAALLLVAAREGLLDVVQYAVESRAPVDAVDAEGRTALQLAAEQDHQDVVRFLEGCGGGRPPQPELFWAAVESGQLDTVRYLLEEKAEVDQTNANGATALSVAAQQGHREMVTLLLAARADVRHTDAEGRTALKHASQHAHATVVRLLLAALATPVPQKVDERSLFAAAEAGDVEAVQRLVQAKAEVDKAERDGRTPLAVACQNGHLAVVQRLVWAGAAVDRAGRGRRMPLFAAAQNGHADVVELLLSSQAALDQTENEGCTPLWVACIRGHLETATLLVGAGAAVDRANGRGATPLHVAAQEGHTEVVDLLLSAQASVDRTDRESCTPLHIAAEEGHAEVVHLLLSAEAMVDEANKNGCTALFIAAEDAHILVVHVLLAAQAAVDKADVAGRTPLFVACYKGQLEVATLLLEAKADLSHPKHDGSTPLFVAAREGHHLVVRWLLEMGADHSVANNKGDNPLWTAVHYQHHNCVQALLEAGADANYCHPQTGQFTLMCAAATGHPQSVDLLLQYGARHDVRDRNGFTTHYHADHTLEERFAPPRLEDLLKASTNVDTAHLEEVLRDPTVNVNAGDKRLHWTPLMEAALYGSAENVARLVASGADPTVPTFSGLTAAFWAELRGDPAVRKALGPTAVLSAAETAGLAEVRSARQRSPAAAELLAFNGVDSSTHEVLRRVGFSHHHDARRRPPRHQSADLSVQERMADVTTDFRAGCFYPERYQCPITLYRFFTTDTDKFKVREEDRTTGTKFKAREEDRTTGTRFKAREEDRTTGTRFKAREEDRTARIRFKAREEDQTAGTRFKAREEDVAAGPCILLPPTATDEEVLALHYMVAEGRKKVAVHVQGSSEDLRDCRPEDCFALFCYTFESIAYKHSNWAMRNWDRPEAQAMLDLWRPFIYHSEIALRRLPLKQGVAYRGIPMGFDADQYGMGQTFLWPAFSSSSESLKVAKCFSLNRSKALIFVINGRSGVSLRYCSYYPEEEEVLFPPNLCLTTKWLGRQSVLDHTDVLLNLPEFVSEDGYAHVLQPHQLTTEEAAEEKVVVVYCEEAWLES